MILEITVTGDDRNVVHRNHVLISAIDSEEAYAKATLLGTQGETSYKNPAGKDVLIRFAGIADLDEITDDIKDGVELLYHYRVGVSRQEVDLMIPSKDRLRVFAPAKRATGPDYASAVIVDLVRTKTGLERP